MQTDCHEQILRISYMEPLVLSDAVQDKQDKMGVLIAERQSKTFQLSINKRYFHASSHP